MILSTDSFYPIWKNKILFYDSKTVLQEILQAEGDGEFSYELKGEEGPDHNKSFWVDAVRNGEVIGSGHGRTKKGGGAAGGL